MFPEADDKFDLTIATGGNFSIPLGAIYVATYSKEMGGHKVKVLDLNVSLKDRNANNPLNIIREALEEAINDFRPNVIGFSGIFLSDEKWVLYCSGLVKSIDEDITTIVGGSFATIETDKALSGAHIDYAVLGEGELIFKNILDCWPNHKMISKLKGIAFKENGRVIINEREQLIQDLDTIPMPDLSMVPLTLYPKNPAADSVNLCSSRGCPFNCSFCSTRKFWGRTIRYHSPARVIEEAKRLRDAYGVTDFGFCDDNFSLDSERLKIICNKFEEEIKKSKKNFAWGCANGLMIQTLNPELIRRMRKAGCRFISLAIESGSERVARDIIHKPIDYKKALEIRDAARNEGIFAAIFFIIGIPGEGLKDMYQTIDFVEKINGDWSALHIYAPIPGTLLYEKAKEIGKIDAKVRHIRSQAAVSTKDFSAQEVKKIQYDANIKYNFLRNRNVLRTEGCLQTEVHKELMKHIVTIYDKHIVGKIVLGYEYWLDGMNNEAWYWWNSAKEDLMDPVVCRDFGPYLELKDEKPIKKWREFLSSGILDRHEKSVC